MHAARTALGISLSADFSAGINKGHVEAMESRLKQNVLKEAQDYGNQIMVSHEDDDFQIMQKWEAVTDVDVQTPLEVYRELEGALLQLLSMLPSISSHTRIPFQMKA